METQRKREPKHTDTEILRHLRSVIRQYPGTHRRIYDALGKRMSLATETKKRLGRPKQPPRAKK